MNIVLSTRHKVLISVAVLALVSTLCLAIYFRVSQTAAEFENVLGKTGDVVEAAGETVDAAKTKLDEADVSKITDGIKDKVGDVDAKGISDALKDKIERFNFNGGDDK